MGVNKTPDGRVNVGLGYSDLNQYKGYAGRREIVIQLTETGATQDSLDALEFLKSYALYHNSVGEPIFPASTNVFISNNGVTKAVEADEVTVDGDNVNIGGCAWNGESWDFTNAGQGGGGSSGGGVLVVNVTETESETNYIYTCDKTAGEILSALEEKVVIFKYEYGHFESCVAGGPYLDGYQFVRGGTSSGDVQFTALALTDYPHYED